MLEFLRMIEVQRHSKPQTRNQRLPLHTFYRFVATHHREMLVEAERVEAIPCKRASPAPTHYLESEEIDRLFQMLATRGGLALRDRALLMLLYNTGARVQEVADLRVGDVDLDGPLRVRLHGKGDKWRGCPISPETATLLKQLDTAWRRKGGALRLGSAPATDALCYLQARQATYPRPRSKRLARWMQDDLTALVSPYDRGPTSGGRSRNQRHPRLAWSCQSGNDQSLR